MEYGRIELLLDKYWACETTPEEEDELRCYFNGTDELPSHLLEFRELFIYQQQERSCTLDNSFDERILAKVSPRKSVWLQNRRWVAGIAASFLLALSIWFLVERKVTVREMFTADTCETPEQAFAEVQRALSYVSVKMKQGQQVAESNMEKMEVATKYIK